MPYATPADLIERFDARIIASVVLDDGSTENVALLPANTKVLNALSEASGDINTAILKGDRYQVSDLEALTGDDKQSLVGLCCVMAFLKLMRRRMYAADEQKKYAEMIRERDEMLKLLRDGSAVFNIQAAHEAGLPDGSRFTRSNDLRRNYLSTQLAGKLFPHRRTFNGE